MGENENFFFFSPLRSEGFKKARKKLRGKLEEKGVGTFKKELRKILRKKELPERESEEMTWKSFKSKTGGDVVMAVARYDDTRGKTRIDRENGSWL